MPTRLRKVRRQRSFRTHGWGTSGQHRDGGMRGGHGKSGWCKHRWTYVVKYERDRIGKKGFKCPTSKDKLTVINLEQLEELALRFGIKDKDEKTKIDLDKLGIDKILGDGTVTKAYTVKVNDCSEKAKNKIEEAGGMIEAKA